LSGKVILLSEVHASNNLNQPMMLAYYRFVLMKIDTAGMIIVKIHD